MHLVLHIGAHGTDGGQIADWIAGNRGALNAQGICAPPPRLFLTRISEALDAGRDTDPQQREETLLRGLGDSGEQRRMVVSAPGLLGSTADVLDADGFYVHDVSRRLYALHTLFPRTRLTVLMAVRTASGVIPMLLPDEPGAAEALLPLIPDDTLPWSRLGAAIRRHLPRAALVAWRHEDLNTVWPRVLGQVVGPDAVLPPNGLLDFALSGLSAEARLRAQRYLTGKPLVSTAQLRHVAHAFAERFGRAPVADLAAPLPGWVRNRLAELDAGYTTEWADLAGLDGVQVLMPR